MQRTTLTPAAAGEALGLLGTVGGSVVWEWMPWLSPAIKHPGVNLDGQALPRFPVSFSGFGEGCSLVLNWSFLLCWNQWLITSCSRVIHYFFSISVKTCDFLLFKITSERLYSLSGFITPEFCLFSSWKSHTGKILSSASAPSHPSVNVLQSQERFLYGGPFLNWSIKHQNKIREHKGSNE